MQYTLDLRDTAPKAIYPLGEKFFGRAPDGSTVGFTNYYMQQNGQPFFGISGEMHFSRIAADEWEDTLIKAKTGGLNMVATYVFWNVHEETEGRFRWDGVRDLRRFLLLCKKHGLLVILRVGPFAHGEIRNGGLPDWLYGKPFEARSCHPGFYACVRRYFRAIHQQADGLYYSQGGPVVACQLDNEYMHSAAPWEMTTGVSNEWVPSGSGGEQYMLDIKRIMQEEGLRTPFYTCTAWGGAITPTEEALPLWGGYAYWPWIFYDGPREHPATPEYLYRDCHNNACPSTYNFEPRYPPESRPYACCEMMGGMQCFYQYRFQLPGQSVDALANIKLGSGCNLLGYYMYRGGSNPTGEKTPYLNECGVPKISYDYQAAIGQYGQLRPAWYRLKTLHDLCRQFTGLLCAARTVLPAVQPAGPEDTAHLRCCVRAAGQSGFVFLNNFQDHLTLPARRAETLALMLPGQTLTIPDISLASGENAILPFNLTLGGALLRYATAQPITCLQAGGETVWFFFAPDGMQPRYCFAAGDIAQATGCEAACITDGLVCTPAQTGLDGFTLRTKAGEALRIVTMSRAESMHFYCFEMGGSRAAFWCSQPLLWDGHSLQIELDGSSAAVYSYPAGALQAFAPPTAAAACAPAQKGIFRGFTVQLAAPALPPLPAPVQTAPGRYLIEVPAQALEGCKAVFLEVDYTGDIGHLFLDGELINDNFANGDTWQTRIDPLRQRLAGQPLTLYIVPIRTGAKVQVDSPMAARLEQAGSRTAQLHRVALRAVRQLALARRQL